MLSIPSSSACAFSACNCSFRSCSCVIGCCDPCWSHVLSVFSDIEHVRKLRWLEACSSGKSFSVLGRCKATCFLAFSSFSASLASCSSFSFFRSFSSASFCSFSTWSANTDVLNSVLWLKFRSLILVVCLSSNMSGRASLFHGCMKKESGLSFSYLWVSASSFLLIDLYSAPQTQAAAPSYFA